MTKYALSFQGPPMNLVINWRFLIRTSLITERPMPAKFVQLTTDLVITIILTDHIAAFSSCRSRASWSRKV